MAKQITSLRQQQLNQKMDKLRWVVDHFWNDLPPQTTFLLVHVTPYVCNGWSVPLKARSFVQEGIRYELVCERGWFDTVIVKTHSIAGCEDVYLTISPGGGI
jgi:hypothetical protein